MDAGAIAAEQLLLKQNVALENVKQSAEAAEGIVNIIEQSTDALKVSPATRGQTVNFTA